MMHLDRDPDANTILPVVVIYIFNRKGELLLFRRKKYPFAGWWEAPGGHINFQERMKEAALRELEEETGIVAGEDELKFVNVMDHIEGKTYHRILISFAFLLKNDTAIKPAEHDEYGWFSINEVPKNILFGPYKEAYELIFGRKK